jgi:hypothetical protein
MVKAGLGAIGPRCENISEVGVVGIPHMHFRNQILCRGEKTQRRRKKKYTEMVLPRVIKVTKC